MAPKYTLHYFNFSGLGETIRYLLHYGGIEFEDKMFEEDEWAEKRKLIPFGRVPVLQIDNEMICQASAICRYLALKIGGLTGADSYENMKIDMMVETVNDLRAEWARYLVEEDEELKAKMKNKISTQLHPLYLGKLNEIVKTNGGYLANGKLSWADIFFAAMTDLFNYGEKGVIDRYPELKNLKEKVQNFPRIKAYLANRNQARPF